ncbi:hypothetical protein FA15DRAFT_723251 [Coprinopsis marcescibilis]|uniref:F-box domain-containing protein n=1 Tax=Coprinopsis marcescibilis TaxID=230819 RepID=A0A5C3KIU6_COPMA|nr:hypothetical protein FA15DRAFT_723251 [Coprinopsis marcescibilis]
MLADCDLTMQYLLYAHKILDTYSKKNRKKRANGCRGKLARSIPCHIDWFMTTSTAKTPDVLEAIFQYFRLSQLSHSTTSTQVGQLAALNAALTTRIWLIPALSARWWMLREIHSLFKLLPIFTFNRRALCYTLTRYPRQSDFARLDWYAPLVRHICYCDYKEDIHPTVFFQIAKFKQGRPLLPHLQSMIVGSIFDDPCLFISPTLKSITFDHSPRGIGDYTPAASTFVSVVSQQLPELRELTLNSSVTQAALHSIGHIKGLRRLRIHFPDHLGINMFLFFQHLASLPTLEKVTMSSQTRALGQFLPSSKISDPEHEQESQTLLFNGTPRELERFVVISEPLLLNNVRPILRPLTDPSQLGLIPPANPSHFSSLDTFHYSGTVAELAHLLHLLPRDTLSSLELDSAFCSVPQERVDYPSRWQPLFNIIRKQSSASLKRICIKSQCCKFPEGSDIFVPGIGVMGPLLSLTHLVSVDLHRLSFITLTDQDIEDMASSWPRLESFYFYNMEPPATTFACFQSFAKHSPNLRSLTIDVDPEGSVPEVNDQFHSNACRLERIWLPTMTFQVIDGGSDEVQVRQYFDRLFPYVQSVFPLPHQRCGSSSYSCDCAWAEFSRTFR